MQARDLSRARHSRTSQHRTQSAAHRCLRGPPRARHLPAHPQPTQHHPVRAMASATAEQQALVPSARWAQAAIPYPPHFALAGNEAGSFAEATITTRLPAILASTVKDLETVADRHKGQAEMHAQILSLIGDVRSLRDEILARGPVTPPQAPQGSHVPAAVRASVQSTCEALKLWEALEGRVKAGAPMEVALAEVMQWSLWGNKTDLSLLVDASGLNPVSSASATHTNSDGTLHPTNPHVIVDEYGAVWARLSRDLGSQGPGRIDIVLDNSGLELYGDLILADFLITQGLAKQVVLHGKPFPWFVSDTLSTDLTQLLSDCGPSSVTPPGLSDAAWDRVRTLGKRWADHLKSGAWTYVAHPFWVTPLPFCWMREAAPQLYTDLSQARLVIFKGDLNYRKLVHDCRWPSTTTWREALQGFLPAPLLALRTLKADVVAGLQQGQAEALSKQDSDWLVNGKWGMVQYCEL